MKRADTAFWTFLGSLAAIFAAVFVVLNVMLMRIVVRPVTRLAALADEVSLGKIDGPDFPAGGDDEVSLLAAVVQPYEEEPRRMRSRCSRSSGP